MKNILVMAYQISPTKGSEYNVAWNYVKRMSKHNNITVICGVSGKHIGDTEEIESYISKNNIPNVSFIFVKSNLLIDFFNSLNRKGLLAYSFYIAYSFWHRKAYNTAKKLVKNNKFDLIHYLGPIGYREPGKLWKLDIPYIWGPIGGLDNINPILASSLDRRGRLKLLIRKTINTFQLKYKTNIRKAIKRTDLLLASTTSNKAIIEKVYKVNCIHFPENGIDKINKINYEKFKDYSRCQFVVIGSLDSRKSIITILKALAKLENKNKFTLNIIGTGPLLSELREYSRVHNLEDSIIWHGHIERSKVFEILRESHLHILTSINEANTTVIFETMSLGVPTLTLDHCGMHDTICDECGFKIPIISYNQIIDDISKTIQYCLDNPSIFKQKAEATIKCAEHYSWDKRELFWLEYYEKAINIYNSKKE